MTKPTMTTIQPDGTRQVRHFEPGEGPSLEELQEAVGGLIQPVDAFLDDGRRAYCNEEFLLHGLAPNPEGSRAVKWPVGEKDFLTGGQVGMLHGNIVILEGFPSEDEED